MLSARESEFLLLCRDEYRFLGSVVDAVREKPETVSIETTDSPSLATARAEPDTRQHECVKLAGGKIRFSSVWRFARAG